MENIFGKRLLDLRHEKAIGQVQLAQELKVGKATISYWEKGVTQPTLSNLIAIAKYFGVSIDYLAGLED